MTVSRGTPIFQRRKARSLSAVLLAVSILAASILTSLLPFSLTAAAEEPKSVFLNAVLSIDGTAAYRDRSAVVLIADETYKILGTEERAEPEVIAAKTALEAERETLKALAEASENYINAIGNAYDDLDAGEGYRTVKANSDLAATYKKDADPTYPGMDSAMAAERSIDRALYEIEQVNDLFLESVERMMAATAYADKEEKIRSAERNLEKVEDFDYDGVEEGIAAIAEAKSDLETRMAGAVAYIALASEVSREGNTDRAASLAAARLAEETADLTFAGAKSAKENLDRYVAEYDEAVAAANAAMTFWLDLALALR